LTFYGEFEPQNVVGNRVDPQKALPYVTTRVLNHIVREIPWTVMHGLLQEASPGKNKNKKERPYVTSF